MIELNIIPKPKVRMVKSDSWKQRPIVLEYWEYKRNLVEQAEKNSLKLQDVLSNITFVLPIPSSWSKKKQLSLIGKPHQNKPDLDNLVKALLDCLCDEDKQIHTFENIRKIWGNEGKILIG